VGGLSFGQFDSEEEAMAAAHAYVAAHQDSNS
jgi:hypothetical protein